MTKKTEEKVTFDADRPVLNDGTFGNPDVLSHNWQENSPAIDLRHSADQGAVNIIAEEKAAEERAKQDKVEKQEPIDAAEYDRRTKLDVSSPEYINPSLGHFKKSK